MNDSIKIVLADDHALIRAGYRSILEDIEEFELVGEAADGEEAIDVVKLLNPDVVVLDITMPKKTGLEAAKEISKACPNVRILMLSMHKEEAYIKESIVNGAHGYLVKDADSEKFIEAIKAIASGEKYYGEISSKVLLEGYLKELSRVEEQKKPKQEYNLSKREREVLELVVQGKTSSEVADELFLSTRTVENHRAHIMQKLDVHSIAELMIKASNEDLL